MRYVINYWEVAASHAMLACAAALQIVMVLRLSGRL